MLDLGKPVAAPALIQPASELTTGDLLGELEAHIGKALVFAYEGRDVLPGYHVTEVKDGVFHALDCGANPESWRETFIQLWDVPPEDDRGFLPVARFLAIMRKVADHVPFDPDAKLTFEVSDGQGAIQLFRADAIEVAGDRIRVGLSRRPASCKPRDRWLEQERASPCCGSSDRAQTCG
jgi:hypothetical protein